MEIPDKNFFSIGEVSRITDVKPYILRYWEQEFRLLRPARRETGQRKYTKKDIELIVKIKDLLYNKKLRIDGAKRFLIEEGKKSKKQLVLDIEREAAALSLLKDIKKELKEILEILK